MLIDVNLGLSLLALLVGSYLAGKILAPLILAIISKCVSTTKTSLDDRIIAEVTAPFESFFFLFIIYAGMKFIPTFSDIGFMMDRYVSAAITLVVTYVAVRVVKALFRWYYEEGHINSRVKIDLSLIPLLQKMSRLFIILIGIAAFAGELGFDLTGVLAITSIVGIIVGLASQESLANIFAGIALQIDRPYTYGDYLRMPATGEVARLKKIGVRTTDLIDNDGYLMVISNSEFAKLRVVKVGSAREPATIMIPFEAPLWASPDEIAARVSARLGRTPVEGVMAQPNFRIRVDKIKYSDYYEGTAMVDVVDPLFTKKAASEVNKLIAQSLREKSRK